MDRQTPEIRHLSKTDPVMKRLIRDIGPYSLTPRMRRSPFESLARAIAYQQLHKKAAESILRRFVALFPTGRFPQPDDLLSMNEQAIRGAGFSQAKVAALRDLAARTLDGTVPTGAIVRKLDDEAIIERRRFEEVGNTGSAFPFAKTQCKGERPTRSAVRTSSPLRSLWPCWTAFLSILRGVPLLSQTC
ncbi:MAG: hypothetical protein E6K66_07995 [Nitrospirae bacterium]|nr:MAG: hypothetical protein E6K66_07995 [Nitrospirota bacterium]